MLAQVHSDEGCIVINRTGSAGLGWTKRSGTPARPRRLRRGGRFVFGSALCALASLAGSAWASGSLQDFPVPPSAVSSTASAVSADGSVVVGSYSTTGLPALVRALRWSQSGGTIDLGVLPGLRLSSPAGVSADGSVVVGTSSNPVALQWRAFRWTASGGLSDLGGLNGGNESFAFGVSADGTVVVGQARDGAAGSVPRAFRWNEAGGMVSLGTLPGGVRSEAFAANADGTMIVGSSTIAASPTTRAFLWTPVAGMSDLGVLPGSLSSAARGISAAGTVVVGGSVPHDAAGNPNPTGAGARAFRWTPAGGMESLGTLNGGPYSYALGVSGDGRTVVGFSADGAAANVQRGYRWTSASGMQKVEDWLRANGVAVPADRTRTANAVSADGSVVVGTFDDDSGYVARVAASGNGMISLESTVAGLSAVGSAFGQGLTATRLLMHGMHGNPLAGRVAVGKNCLRVAGDAARDDHSDRSGSIGILEIGVCTRLSAGLQLEAGVGSFRSRQDLTTGGRSDLDGQYGIVEALFVLPGTQNLWGTATAVYQTGNLDTRRGYLNAGAQDFSSGTPDMSAFGWRVRLDWEDAARVGPVFLTPYVDLSRQRASRSGYAEQGGGFPARYDGQTGHSTELRLGLTSPLAVSVDTRIILTLEGAHQFESELPRTTGDLVGLFPFDLPGQSTDRNWLRLGAALTRSLGPGAITAALNATTAGSSPSYWLNVDYRVPF